MKRVLIERPKARYVRPPDPLPIDPRDPEHVQRFPDIAWRPFLTRMRGEKKARVARAAKYVFEFARRVPGLG